MQKMKPLVYEYAVHGAFYAVPRSRKKLGSYYLPITTRAVTKTGMSYREPSGFEE